MSPRPPQALTDAPQPQRFALIRSLYAVSLFKDGKYDEAIDIFIELDTNPAHVVSLYPDSIAGRLSTPEKDWIVLFGGPREDIPIAQEPEPSEEVKVTEEPQKAEDPEQLPPTSTSAAPTQGATPSLKGYLPTLMRSAAKDDDTASIASRRSMRRRVTMDIFETFGIPSTTSNPNASQVAGAPAPAPTATVSAQLSAGVFLQGPAFISHSNQT